MEKPNLNRQINSRDRQPVTHRDASKLEDRARLEQIREKIGLITR